MDYSMLSTKELINYAAPTTELERILLKKVVELNNEVCDPESIGSPEFDIDDLEDRLGDLKEAIESAIDLLESGKIDEGKKILVDAI